jgi:hypothetical protein
VLLSFLVGFSIPIVFALSIFDRWVHKVGLPHSRRGSVSVAGDLEVAICATTFSYVGHLFDLKEKDSVNQGGSLPLAES